MKGGGIRGCDEIISTRDQPHVGVGAEQHGETRLLLLHHPNGDALPPALDLRADQLQDLLRHPVLLLRREHRPVLAASRRVEPAQRQTLGVDHEPQQRVGRLARLGSGSDRLALLPQRLRLLLLLQTRLCGVAERDVRPVEETLDGGDLVHGSEVH